MHGVKVGETFDSAAVAVAAISLPSLNAPRSMSVSRGRLTAVQFVSSSLLAYRTQKQNRRPMGDIRSSDARLHLLVVRALHPRIPVQFDSLYVGAVQVQLHAS